MEKISVRRGRRLGWAAAGLLVVGLVAAGCGGAGSQAGAGNTPETVATTASTTTTTKPAPTPEELNAWALTVADLPPGWAAEPKKETTTTKKGGSGGSSEGSPNDFMCESARGLEDSDDVESAEVEFKQSDNGPFIMQSLGAGPHADTAYDKAKQALAGCVGQHWTADASGTPIDLTAADVSPPRAGDESVAWRVSGTAKGLPLEMAIDFVLVRRGAVVQLYGAINLQSSVLKTSPLSPAQLAAIIKTGDEKIAGKLGAA